MKHFYAAMAISEFVSALINKTATLVLPMGIERYTLDLVAMSHFIAFAICCGLYEFVSRNPRR